MLYIREQPGAKESPTCGVYYKNYMPTKKRECLSQAGVTIISCLVGGLGRQLDFFRCSDTCCISGTRIGRKLIRTRRHGSCSHTGRLFWLCWNIAAVPG